MSSMAFFLLISSLVATQATSSRLSDSPPEASDKSPFAQCNPFNSQAKGITSCEEYFQSFPLNIEACDLNLAWHDICFGVVPEGKGSLRQICPDECASKVLDPESENEDALAVQNFIDFLQNYDMDELEDGRRHLITPTCNEGFQDVTNDGARYWYCGRHCQGGLYWVDSYCDCACEEVPEGYEAHRDYGSGQGNLIDQDQGLTVEQCAELCNGQGANCAGFTFFDGRLCELKTAITLERGSNTHDRTTYVKIPVYTKSGYSQCFTYNTQYPGDRLDNPMFSYWIGVMTGSECEARCNTNSDQYGRPCVAFEHSSQNYDASANCAHAWACDYTQYWGGGAVYKRN